MSDSQATTSNLLLTHTTFSRRYSLIFMMISQHWRCLYAFLLTWKMRLILSSSNIQQKKTDTNNMYSTPITHGTRIHKWDSLTYEVHKYMGVPILSSALTNFLTKNTLPYLLNHHAKVSGLQSHNSRKDNCKMENTILGGQEETILYKYHRGYHYKLNLFHNRFPVTTQP